VRKAIRGSELGFLKAKIQLIEKMLDLIWIEWLKSYEIARRAKAAQ
jgi:hypothetical protein